MCPASGRSERSPDAGAYPPAAATLSGTLLTIDRLLRNPTFLARRLRGIPDLRFVADQILTRKIKANGGAAMAETGEPIVNSRPIESIAPAASTRGTARRTAPRCWSRSVSGVRRPR